MCVVQRSDPKDSGYADGLVAFPPGFQIVAGDPSLRSYTNTPEQNAITFTCLGTNTKEIPRFPNIKCPNGLRAQIFFPSFWDGVKFNLTNQKDHLAYPSAVDTGNCPPKFNKRLISIFYEVIRNTPDFDDEWYRNS
jgi:hypothetical protein